MAHRFSDVDTRFGAVMPSPTEQVVAATFYDAPPPNPSSITYRSRHLHDGDLDDRNGHKIHHDYRHVSSSDAAYEKTVVKSAQRTLQVFEFFTEYRRAASASEIAINLDLPQSSTSMLLRSLVSLGYLGYDAATRLYAPSLRLSLIGAWRPERVGVASDILQLIEQLHMETGECVMLAEQYKHFVRYIYVLQSADPDKVYYVPLGILRPICTTAFGQIMLSLKSDKEMRMLVHRARSDRDSADYGVGIDTVAVAVERARALGYAFTSRLVDGFRSYQLATLLPGDGDAPALAIGLSSYGDRFTDRKAELLDRLLHVARQRGVEQARSHS